MSICSLYAKVAAVTTFSAWTDKKLPFARPHVLDAARVNEFLNNPQRKFGLKRFKIELPNEGRPWRPRNPASASLKGDHS
jgi:hypothetical protein